MGLFTDPAPSFGVEVFLIFVLLLLVAVDRRLLPKVIELEEQNQDSTQLPDSQSGLLSYNIDPFSSNVLGRHSATLSPHDFDYTCPRSHTHT